MVLSQLFSGFQRGPGPFLIVFQDEGASLGAGFISVRAQPWPLRLAWLARSPVDGKVAGSNPAGRTPRSWVRPAAGARAGGNQPMSLPHIHASLSPPSLLSRNQ